MIARRSLLGLALLVGAFSASACDDSTGFGEMSEIESVTDRFEYAVSDLKRHTSTHEYGWSNTGATATVYQNTAVTGSAELVILDADGVQVYARSLADNGTFESAAGAPGSWTIRVALTAASGTVIFRVTNPTTQSP